MWQLYGQEFFSLAVIHFLAVILPGPDFLITLQQSLKYGRKHGVITALGIGAGISVHVLYTLIGVAILFQTHAWLMASLQLLAAAYLCYLARHCLASSTAPNTATLATATPSRVPSWQRSFLTGFFCNALNPKATIFFLAIFSSIVSPQTPLNIQIAYGAWMCSINALWFIVVSYIFTQQQIRQKFLAYSCYIERIMGGLLMLIALRIGYVALQSLCGTG
ncbi:LysE family translocator [Acinetobacter larvae]|uniref:Lysine transporter LysE n=1 Tax=Acinetobacter larvae TaxID=1789224 RepID=A0A1B2M3E0_9GAMM|nr:LysE family transporter [Acinetobacter larvae]AOA59716.1 lysine transporter LysE [Acinetobacter larvae]